MIHQKSLAVSYDNCTGTNITGVNILDVNLIQNGAEVSYIKVPLSRIAELEKVIFKKEDA